MDNGHEPATKADLQSLKDELKADLQSLKHELKADLQSLKDELFEAMHDTETRLLRAFYDFAESNQKRLGATETLAALVVDRLGSIERRVTDIEKRLNTP